MKAPLKYTWILVGFAAAAAIAACAGKNSATGASCPAGYALGGPSGQDCVAVSVIPTGIPAGTKIGFYAQTSNFQGLSNNGSILTKGSGLTSLLRDAMGVCDRDNSNCGQAACDAWVNGYHDIVVMFDGSSANQAKVMVRSYPYVNPYYTYTCSIPSFSQFFAGLFGVYTGNTAGVFDPLVLTTTIWPINNSQGFELRANGPTNSAAWWRLFQFQVMNGKLEDPTVNFTLWVDDGNQNRIQALSGTMVRCQTQNCGVPGL